MAKSIRRKRVTAALVFTVQDRRSRARTLRETNERKAALLALGPSDVAHRLHIMRPPEEIMDTCDNTLITSIAHLSTVDSTVFDNLLEMHRVPKTYEQWLEEGFPVDFWRPLLLTELYHPLEAQQKYFQTKYTLASKLQNDTYTVPEEGQ